MIVIGLISGTSADAIDAAVVEVRQEQTTLALKLRAFVAHQFDPQLHERLRALLPPATGSVAEVCELHMLLGRAFAEAARAGAAAASLTLEQADLIASHGQTVYHQVAPGRTRSSLQLGAPAAIAAATGRTVVADFRLADIAAGGQGAPLAPLLDALLWSHPARARVVQNIGGIANLTYLPAGAQGYQGVLAFDTGPGNTLIDEAVRLLSAGRLPYDRDGAWAAQGRASAALLARWMDDPYFAAPPPKSTGREYFDRSYASRRIAEARGCGLSDADALATLTALTARSIAEACRRFLPALPDDLIVSGGGAHNRTLMAALARELPGTTLLHAGDLGLPGDAKEAVLFALLGYATLHGWPGNLPACTGAARAVPLGSITPGANYHALLASVVARPRPLATSAVVE